MMEMLKDESISKLKDIANRPLHHPLRLNKETTLTSTEAYLLGLDDGETIIARYILHSMRIYYSKNDNIKLN